MKQRWLVVALGLPLLLAVLLFAPAWATLMVMCAITGVAAYELLHTAGAAEKTMLPALCGFTIAAAVAQEVARFLEYGGSVSPLYGVSRVTILQWVLVMGLFFCAVRNYGTERAVSFRTVAVAIVAGIVFPALYSGIFLLRQDALYGKLYVLAPFCIAFAGDALSRYFGMWFGKRKMAPRVSPHKTWAGFLGGPVGSALAMCLLGAVGARWLGYAPHYPMLLLVGVLGNLFGQLGDLSMSLVKRESGVKDYSHLFLTHGGMLDRFDSTLFIAPVVYFFVSAGVI